MSASLRTLKRWQFKTRDCKLSSLSIELKGILKKIPDGLNISYSHRYLSQISVKTGGLICTESSKCSNKDDNGSICYFEYILQFKEIYFWFIGYQ